jgi:Fuc2NAc and GlcNAc transferase
MLSSSNFYVFASGFGISLVLVLAYLKLAPRIGFLDIPTQRSSHKKPTIRGAGLAFVIGISLGVFGFSSSPDLVRLTAFADLIAVLGLIDDYKGLPAIHRLFTHVALGLAAMTTISANGSDYLVMSLILLSFVAYTNIFNFMDGIDGLATLQAISIILGWIFLGSAGSDFVWVLGCLLAFLIFNWSPAKAFMGDVGSGFLGFFLAGCAWIMHFQGFPIIASLILTAGFLTDSAFTITRRAWYGEKVYRAHRDHAYQHMVQLGFTHSQATLIYGIVTLAWCAPLAKLAIDYAEYSVGLLILACVPFIILCVRYKAGKPLVASTGH